MKTIPVLLIFLLLLSISVKAQEVDSCISLTGEASAEVYDKIYKREFTSLLTGQNTHTPGTFASLDVTTSQVTFSPSYILSSGDIVTATLSGGNTNGTLSLFQNTELNTNFSGDFQYHFFSDKLTIFSEEAPFITFNSDDELTLNQKRQDIWNAFEEKEVEIRSKEVELETKLKDLDVKIQRGEMVLSILDSLSGKFSSGWSLKLINMSAKKTASEKRLKKTQDSLKLKLTDTAKITRLVNEQAVLKTKIALYQKTIKAVEQVINQPKTKNLVVENIRNELNNLKRQRSVLLCKQEQWSAKNGLLKAKLLNRNIKERNKQLKEQSLAKNLKVNGFHVGWFSVGYKAKNSSFKLLHPDSAYASQIEEKVFLTHEVSVQYSEIHLTSGRGRHENYFVAVKLAYRQRDNQENLPTRTIEETTPLGNNGTQRERVERYTAYQGDYRSGINEVDFTVDYYALRRNPSQSDDNLIAWHYYPGIRFSDGNAPLTSLGLGLVYEFRDKKNNKSFINAELYCEFSDVFNVNRSQLSLWDKNSIGLRFTLPFFINLNR